MATADHRKRVRWEDLNDWHYLAVFFGAVTVVAAAGEWVFRWW